MSNLVVAQPDVLWAKGEIKNEIVGPGVIYAWQAFYLDPITKLAKLAKADDPVKAVAVGIALNYAYPGQPVSYLESGGEIQLAANLLFVGEQYVLSAATDGGITTLPDVGPGHYLTYLFRAIAVNRLVVEVNATGIIIP